MGKRKALSARVAPSTPATPAPSRGGRGAPRTPAARTPAPPAGTLPAHAGAGADEDAAAAFATPGAAPREDGGDHEGRAVRDASWEALSDAAAPTDQTRFARRFEDLHADIERYTGAPAPRHVVANLLSELTRARQSVRAARAELGKDESDALMDFSEDLRDMIKLIQIGGDAEVEPKPARVAKRAAAPRLTPAQAHFAHGRARGMYQDDGPGVAGERGDDAAQYTVRSAAVARDIGKPMDLPLEESLAGAVVSFGRQHSSADPLVTNGSPLMSLRTYFERCHQQRRPAAGGDGTVPLLAAMRAFVTVARAHWRHDAAGVMDALMADVLELAAAAVDPVKIMKDLNDTMDRMHLQLQASVDTLSATSWADMLANTPWARRKHRLMRKAHMDEVDDEAEEVATHAEVSADAATDGPLSAFHLLRYVFPPTMDARKLSKLPVNACALDLFFNGACTAYRHKVHCRVKGLKHERRSFTSADLKALGVTRGEVDKARNALLPWQRGTVTTVEVLRALAKRKVAGAAESLAEAVALVPVGSGAAAGGQ